jgi:CheY-like chemotaxis protein
VHPTPVRRWHVHGRVRRRETTCAVASAHALCHEASQAAPFVCRGSAHERRMVSVEHHHLAARPRDMHRLIVCERARGRSSRGWRDRWLRQASTVATTSVSDCLVLPITLRAATPCHSGTFFAAILLQRRRHLRLSRYVARCWTGDIVVGEQRDRGPVEETHHTVVLIVEDEQPIAEALAMIVADAGYVPLLAPHGDDGLALARAIRPALIFTDLMMPRMKGDQLIAALHESAALTRHTAPPIILMTAVSGRLTYGADALLRKPFDIRTVEALLHRFLPLPPPPEEGKAWADTKQGTEAL